MVLGGRMSQRATAGRRSKGDRDHLTTRPPLVVGSAVRAKSKSLGYEYVSDYVAALLARDVEMDDLAPAPGQVDGQGALPGLGRGDVRLAQSA